jgi:hypothetical protein
VLLGDVTQQPHPYVDDSNESSRVILSLRGITQSTETRNEVTLEIGIHQDLNYNTTQEICLDIPDRSNSFHSNRQHQHHGEEKEDNDDFENEIEGRQGTSPLFPLLSLTFSSPSIEI